MKLIHTADWHLGQTFFEYDRKEEHVKFLTWLKRQIFEREADVLLIAGDLFDSPNPSAESQRIFYAFLREVTNENPNLQVVIIAGNHDSAARLEAPDPLLEEMGVTVRGMIRRNADGNIDFNHLIIPLFQHGQIAAYCLAVPYLRQGDYPQAPTYALGVQAMYEQLYKEVETVEKPVIAMGHLQATGAEIAENDRSERTIIGGLECISPDSFAPGIKYTALGHLHRSQRVAKRGNVRYSGTPFPMSFAERNNKHGVVLVGLDEEKTEIEMLEFPASVKLLSIPSVPKKLPEVLAAIKLLPQGKVTSESPFLEIRVLITEPEPSLRYQLEEALRGKSVRLARIGAETPPKEETDDKAISYEELQTLKPMDIAIDFFKRKFGGEDMPETMKQMLHLVIQEVGL